MPATTRPRPTGLLQKVHDLDEEIRRLRRSTAASQRLLWEYDTFTIASGTDTTHTLAWLPYGINVVLLNGVGLVEGTDYTADYTTGIVTVSATLTAGDVLHVRYVTTGELKVYSTVADTGAIVDTFNRADSATTLNPASDGGSYTVMTGAVMGIAGNQGYTVSISGGTTFIGQHLAYRDAGSNAVVMTIDNARSDTTGSSAIVICYDPATGNGYAWQFDSSSTFGSLTRVTSNAATTPGATAFPAVAWTSLAATSLRLIHDGSGNVTAQQLVSGTWTTIATMADAAFASVGTCIGFGTSNAGSDRWDNLSVTL